MKEKITWSIFKEKGFIINLTRYDLLVDGKHPTPNKMVRIRYSPFSSVYTVYDNFFFEKEFKTLKEAKLVAINLFKKKNNSNKLNIMKKTSTKKKDTCAAELGRKGGLKAKRMKVGIFSPSYKKKVKAKRKAPKSGL